MISKSTRIEKIMEPHPKCVYRDDNLASINEIFKTSDFHHLLVVDREGDIVGILSEADFKYAMEQIARNTSGATYTKQIFENWKAERLMTANPTTILAEDEIQKAADYFLQNNFHALPVIDGSHKLVGIITSHDLLKYAYA